MAETDPIVVSLALMRYAQHLSVRALAAKTGLSSSSISEWENGHLEPTLANVRAWAAGLGLEPTLATAPPDTEEAGRG